MKKKFDNIDRQHVISAIEKKFESKLSKVGKRQIYLKNSQNIYFVVLGGIEDWHGIYDDVIEDIKSVDEKYLVIAIKQIESLKIYFCEMTIFLQSKIHFSRPGNDRYIFNIDEYDTYARIRQAPKVTLELLSEVSYTFSDRENIETNEAVKKVLKQMSPNERAELLQSLKDK